MNTPAQMLEYVKASDEAISLLTQENGALTQKVAALEQEVRIQKQASAAPAPKLEEVQQMADRLVAARILEAGQKEAAVTAVMGNPLTLIPFLTKLAAQTAQQRQVPVLGRPAEPATPPVDVTMRESDQVFLRHFGVGRV